jgi:hypothetical protein
MSSAYEIAVSDVAEDGALESEAGGLTTAELRIQRPGQDRHIMGFPCLSHISLTLEHGRLHLAATYRNHHFIRKAYGNYLGLIWLLDFLAHESGCQVGEILCLSTHADGEFGLRGGKTAIKQLIRGCRAAVRERDDNVLRLSA